MTGTKSRSLHTYRKVSLRKRAIGRRCAHLLVRSRDGRKGVSPEAGGHGRLGPLLLERLESVGRQRRTYALCTSEDSAF